VTHLPRAHSGTLTSDPTAAPQIRLQNLRKCFNGIAAVDGINLDIFPGELFALLGGSGSGKTTLLRMLGGFETPTEGKIWIDGADMTGVPAFRRPVNTMFQSYALFPHMSVFDNIAYGLRRERIPKQEIEPRVMSALAMVQLSNFARRRPHSLSGGQRQRVALARSLVKRPRVLLLDEPLSALDRKLREETQGELAEIHRKLGITFILVTHDQEEAMSLATRIAVMDRGHIVQIGTARELYEYPATRFVADFIGRVNLLDGVLSVDTTERAVMHCPQAGYDIAIGHAVPGNLGMKFSLALRPEKIQITEKPHPDLVNSMPATVVDVVFHGALSFYRVRLASGMILKVALANPGRAATDPFSAGQSVMIGWADNAAVVLTQ